MAKDSKWFVFKIGTKKTLFSGSGKKQQTKRFALFKYLQIKIARKRVLAMLDCSMVALKPEQHTSCEKQVTHAQKIRAYIMNMQAGMAHSKSKIRACFSDPRPTLRMCTQGQHEHLSGLELSQVTIEPDGRIKACVMYKDSIVWVRIDAEKVRLVSKYCNEMEVTLNEPRLASIDSRRVGKMKPIQQGRNMQHAHNATPFKMVFSDWYMQEFHSKSVPVAEAEPLIHTPGSMARAVRDRKRHLQKFKQVDLGDERNGRIRLDVLRQAIFSAWGRPGRAQVLSKIEEDDPVKYCEELGHVIL